jgi:hypothetical protein
MRKGLFAGLLLCSSAWACKPDQPSKSEPRAAASRDTAHPVPGPSVSSPQAAIPQPASGLQQGPNPLLIAIDSSMRRVKPDLETTSLVSLLPVGHGDSKWYMVLAVGRGPHRSWKSLEDVGEVYAVFWVDKG